MSSNLIFKKLPSDRLKEAIEVLTQASKEIRRSGRKQRIANIDFDTYSRWQSDNVNFVVLADKEIAGLVTLRDEVLADWPAFIHLGEVPMMRGLITNPPYRGKGVGKFAVERLIENFGSLPIYLDCVVGFLPQYYSALGFKLLASTTVAKDEPGGSVTYEICLMKFQHQF